MGLRGIAGLVRIALIFGICCLIPEIFSVLTLQKALQRSVPESRTISQGSAWLMLIPLFNVVWDFILVSQMAAPPVPVAARIPA